MPELDLGAFLPPPSYKLSSQNTPYKLGLKSKSLLIAKGIDQPHESHIFGTCIIEVLHFSPLLFIKSYSGWGSKRLNLQVTFYYMYIAIMHYFTCKKL